MSAWRSIPAPNLRSELVAASHMVHYHLMAEFQVSPSLLTRFWKRVRYKPGDCWDWDGAHTSAGYGHLYAGKREDGRPAFVLAHRLAYEQEHRPIPAGFQVDHLCRNPGCVNSLHMELVTNRQNGLRGLSAIRRSHCSHGHPATPANTYIRPDRGTPECRACRKRNMDAYLRRKQLAAGLRADFD